MVANFNDLISLLECPRCGAVSTDWLDWGEYIEANCDCPEGRTHLNWVRYKPRSRKGGKI